MNLRLVASRGAHLDVPVDGIVKKLLQKSFQAPSVPHGNLILVYDLVEHVRLEALRGAHAAIHRNSTVIQTTGRCACRPALWVNLAAAAGLREYVKPAIRGETVRALHRYCTHMLSRHCVRWQHRARQVFEDLTRPEAAITGAPTALVSRVDGHRQSLKLGSAGPFATHCRRSDSLPIPSKSVSGWKVGCLFRSWPAVLWR